MDLVAIVSLVVTLQAILVLGFVLLERRDPSATLAWILGVVLLPLVGGLLYFGLGRRRKVLRSREFDLIAQRSRASFHRWNVAQKTRGAGPAALPDRIRPFVQLGTFTVGSFASRANRVKILVNGERTYREIALAISQAQHHIHVEFYIIQPDETGRALRDRLVVKAKEGVEVRVIYDAVGSYRLPRTFWQPLKEAGGQVAVFAPVKVIPFWRVRDHINFRNHRKIVVVDGKVGLTGGINVGREYLGLDPQVGAWRDTHVRIDGPAVLAIQQTFIEDWLHSSGQLLDSDVYFPDPGPEGPGESTVQVIASGPDRRWAVIHYLHLLAVSRANERIWLTTPYFVPDRPLLVALVMAALRGVDVRILVPKKTDSFLVNGASRYYYEELLAAGVRIYEYEAGFLHAKTMVVDDWMATIGSSNLDIRSFALNYEMNAFAYDQEATKELAALFLEDLGHASEVPHDWFDEQGVLKKVFYAVAGLLSPLL